MSVHFGPDFFQVDGGLRLVRRHWRASEATRVVALVHGLAEHSERYDAVARWLAVRGYSVHAFDQRGHGDSEGPRNHASSFDALLDDLERFLGVVRREEPDPPLVLLGHSMGGLLVAALLAWRRPCVAAAVLSGPALAPVAPVGSVGLALVRLVSRVLPRLRISAGIDPEGLSRDPTVVTRYVEDPLVDTKITLSLAVEMLDAASRTLHAGRDLALPLLMLHGGADPLCLSEGSRRFFAQLPSGEARDSSELHIYPELRHEIFNEPEREKVFSDILGWIAAGERRGG